MAMNVTRSKADVNVTPMIDVLLVLLIIFMVIMPTLSVGLPVRLPQPGDGQARLLPPQNVVLTVLGGGKVLFNKTEIEMTDLPDTLDQMLKQHSAGIAFVKGSGQLDFAQVAEVIDVAKGAGWSRIGLVSEPRQ